MKFDEGQFECNSLMLCQNYSESKRSIHPSIFISQKRQLVTVGN